MNRTGLLALLALGAVALPTRAWAMPASGYQIFRMDVGASGAYGHGDSSYGIAAFVEPKINLLDDLAVGLRLEGAALFGGSVSGSGEDVSMGVRASSAYLAKADYFLTNSSVRPFVGLGLGLYNMGSQKVEASGEGSASVAQQAGRYFGVAPQLGINLGGFRVAVTYNVIVGADYEVRQTAGTGSQSGATNVSQNYVTLDLGGRFGGNRKE